MVKIVLTPELKIFIEKNVNLSNRDLSAKIADFYNIKASHTIVGRHKKSFLESGLETSLETKIMFPKIDVQDLDLEKYYQKVEDFLTLCKNRGAAKRILRSTAKSLIDEIVLDLQKN